MMSEDDLYAKMERLRRQDRLKVVRVGSGTRLWKLVALAVLIISLTSFFLFSSLR
jgi:hypothetical protein